MLMLALLECVGRSSLLFLLSVVVVVVFRGCLMMTMQGSDALASSTTMGTRWIACRLAIVVLILEWPSIAGGNMHRPLLFPS